MALERGAIRGICRNIRLAVQKEDYAVAIRLTKCHGSPSAQRLASHALIHSMLRSRPVFNESSLIRITAQLVEIMRTDIQIHPRTMTVHFRRMFQQAKAAPSSGWSKTQFRQPTIVKLEPIKVRNTVLRSAYFLFLQARQNFQIRTQDMYMALFVALLHQGDYVAAVLLFEHVAQDHALLLALPSAIEEAKKSGSSDYESLKKRLNHLEAENLVPSRASLHLISKHLMPKLRRPNDFDSHVVGSCIQCAVILGALLDRGQLPKEGKLVVVTLLRAVIASVSLDNHGPPRDFKVFVDVEPEPILVNAVEYARQVLKSTQHH
ncbi:hypothetical protein C0995_010187 [Termitomyces sp. Mi166|nr:hypothetical protein C0995_010187 [Termitomyces sp. Mi166\